MICHEGTKIPYLYLSLKSQKERDQLYDKIIQQPGEYYTLTFSLMNIHARLHPLRIIILNYINKLSCWYIEQRNYLSGLLV